MFQRLIERTDTLTDIVTTDTTIEIDLDRVETLSIQAAVDVNTPAADTFADGDVDTDEDTITLTAHDFTTGLKAALSNSGGALPGGTSATNYYLIVLDEDTVQLATSLANALAGTAVNITSAAGGGTHTLTPASISGGSIKLQKSNDRSNWADDGNAQTISADGSFWLEADPPTGRWARVYITLTAGRLSADVNVLAKG